MKAPQKVHLKKSPQPTPEVADGQLLQICCISAEAARLVTPISHPKRSSFKDGWSPALIAMKY